MKIKNLIKIIVPIIAVILTIIITIVLIGKLKNKREIDDMYELLEENNIQDTDNTDLKLENGVIGIIKIEKIGFEGLVYEGTELSTLDKSVGHFENSPIFNGNVCLAAHNNSKFWKNLNKLQEGDLITYTCLLGKKTYKVCNINIISSDDWTLLENSDTNFITLITCVHKKPSQRLCVQGIEDK